ATYERWMENMHDWAISRQNIWGIRIPAWYNVDNNPNLIVTFVNDEGVIENGQIVDLLKRTTLTKIEKGLQTLIAPANATFDISTERTRQRFIQETNTFDTWFSSGQWPLATLGYPSSPDFKYF